MPFMEKASVDENNNTALWKNKIGRARKLLGAQTPAMQAGSQKH